MLRGMTGFGQAAGKGFVVEISCVNRRHLDLIVRGPARRLEGEIRSWLTPHLRRGRVEVTVRETSEQPASLNTLALNGLAGAAKELSETTGVDLGRAFELLAKEETLLIREELTAETLHPLIEKALKEVISSREAEGEAIASDIAPRLDEAGRLLEEIAARAGSGVEAYRERLKQKLEELGAPDERRLLTEVALLADKCDYSEEVARFRHHLQTFQQQITSQQQAAGKSIEFLLQELIREINTIGSKAQDVEVSSWVVQVKGELEKVREQLQNVE